MKRILFVPVLLFAAAMSHAQSQESYDLKEVSPAVYKDCRYRVRNAVDSIIYYSDIDSLSCVVIDDVSIMADGTTVHQAKVSGGNEEVNRKIEKALSEIKLPEVALADEAGNVSPVDATASFSIVRNHHKVWDEYVFEIDHGYPIWGSEFSGVHLDLLNRLADVAFYTNDSGRYKVRFSTYKINEETLTYGIFHIYKLRRNKEVPFISYSGKAVLDISPFKRSEEDLEKARDEAPQLDSKPSFMGGDAGNFSRYVSSKLNYPDYAKGRGIVGTVKVQFSVNEKGVVEKVRVREAVHPTLDREAVRAVSSSPKWKPGYKEGKPVSVFYSHPLIFILH